MDEQRNHRAAELAKKWRTGTINENERKELEAWYSSFDSSYLQEDSTETVDQLKERMFHAIQDELALRPKTGKHLALFSWKFARIAASLLVILSVGGYFYRLSTSQKAAHQQRSQVAIRPGSNQAMLTLRDGSQIVLADADNGLISRQGTVQVMKKDSVIAYRPVAVEEEVVYNTITTPRGGQFQVVLADGTRVWLNSASSLRFPTSFSGTERKVTVTGEAYFEVSKDRYRPFLVDVDQRQTVRVTGTHFNIMAYADEKAISTTLLEGSVIAQKDGQSVALKPGQQAQLLASGKLVLVNGVDTDAAVAWKNGFTSFADADIQAIMRQISRWYDVDVVFRGTPSQRTFTGGIARNSAIEGVFKILELSNIHFSVEGKKVIVTP